MNKLILPYVAYSIQMNQTGLLDCEAIFTVTRRHSYVFHGMEITDLSIGRVSKPEPYAILTLHRNFC